jgi:hypothetical protein
MDEKNVGELWSQASQTVGTLQQFIDAVAPLSPDSGAYESGQYWYRGQTNVAWGLESSLMRITRNVRDQPRVALTLEEAALKEFMSKAHLFVEPSHLAKVKTTPCWWAIMQHFGAPTRLLDWTVSPYVAAYFAAHQDGVGNDGAVWCFCHSRLHDVFRSEYGDLPDFTQSEAEDTTGTVRRLHQRLAEVNAEQAVAPLAFKFFSSPRMAEQQGRFTMSLAIHQDHACMISAIRTHAKRLIIPYAAKPAILAELRRMNITAAALFPGIDGLGRSIAELTSLGIAFKDSHQFTV